MPRKNKSTAPAAPRPLTGPQRLNKVLAAAGLGSRRDCEQFILDGRIEVDGQAVTDLATKVDPETAKITFDGSQLKTFRPVYYALHKPTSVLSTNFDPSGRMRAIDLVNVKERVFSVGRLDRFSEGLMLLTNDGELAQRLAHPRFGVQKLYLATVQGEITQADLEKLVRGVRLSEGFAKVDAVKLRRQRQGAAELEIALSEGKNREIRRILARLGHKVVGLKRLAIGPLRLGQLPVGGWRPLTREEVLALYATTAYRTKRRGPARPRKAGPQLQEDADPSLAVGSTVGHFNQPFDDEDDDDFGALPIFGDESDDQGDDDEFIALSDEPVIGTVIPYEDEEEMLADAAAADDERPRRGPRGDRPSRSARPQSDRRGSGQRAGSRSGGSASPNDLRNRQSATGRGSRTGAPRGDGASSAAAASPEGFSWGAARRRTGGARPTGSRTGGPKTGRSPRSTPRTGSGSAPRTAAAAGRTSSSKPGGTRSPTARPTAGRSGAGKPAPGRSTGARAGGVRTGAPRSGTPRLSAGRPSTGRPSIGKPGTGKPGTGKPSTGRSSNYRATGGRPAAAGGKPRSAGRPGSSGRASFGGGGGGGGGARGAGVKGKRGGGRPSGGGGGSGPRGKRK